MARFRMLLLLPFLWPLTAFAAFNALLWDNDLFSPRNTDAYYTNGFLYHHMSDPVVADEGRDWAACPGLSTVARLVDPLIIQSDDTTQYRHSWGMGQIIQTPWDLNLAVPDPDDQPYAGLLYGSCGFHAQQDGHADSLSLILGVTGPWSLAEHGQDIAHRITGSKQPAGWAHQLRNEVVLNLTYDRQHVLHTLPLRRHNLTFFDNAGFSLGTLVTGVTVGLNALYSTDPRAAFTLRPNFLGRFPWLSQRQPLGFYAMGSVQGSAIARNIFVDGNTWVDSPSVDREPFTASSQLVVGYGFSCLALQMGLNIGTRTFETQGEKWPRYGTLGVIWGCSP